MPRGWHASWHGLLQGCPLSQTIMTQTFLRHARAAGVTERTRVTPQTLRHVFASELLRAA